MAEPSPAEKLNGKVWDMLSSGLALYSMSMASDLGVFQLMAGARDPVSSTEIAAACSCSERFVEEMLRQLVAMGMLTRTPEGRYGMDDAQRAVLGDTSEANPFDAEPLFNYIPKVLAPRWGRHQEAFKTGRGLTYDENGPEATAGIAKLTTGHAERLTRWLQSHDDVAAKLSSSAVVADIGCGSGNNLVHLAKTFPTSTFHGYDTSREALAAAKARAEAAGVADRVVLHNPDEGGVLPNCPTFDVIYNVDVLHDMVDARPVISAGRKAVKAGGKWFMVEPKALDSVEENLALPEAGLMYGFSCYMCLTSAMSEPSGPAVGAMGFTKAVAEDWFVAHGGWTSVTAAGAGLYDGNNAFVAHSE